jgi:DNA-binding CsgD family transcriptional regulator
VAGAHLRVEGPLGPQTVPLQGTRFTVGKAPGNDLVLDDPSTSRLHLVLEPAGPTWLATDAGSTNGSWVNGKRIGSAHALRDGDRIVVGAVTLVVAIDDPGRGTATAVLSPPPPLTHRERELLAALCRPVLEGGMLSEPASVREMAAALWVSESAVKKALGRLYSKFGLQDEERRRGHLAIAAIRAGIGSDPPR